MTRAEDLLNVEIEKYKSNTPLSFQKNLVSENYMPGGNTRVTQWIDPYPFFVEKGDGHNLYDIDGNKYLDFMINATTLILGHSHPKVVASLSDQVKKGVSFSAPTESQSRLAKLLVERIPSIEKIRFTNSGTEATMLSIMAARAFTNRSKIAKFEGGYHGSQDHVSISVNPSKKYLGKETNPGVLEHNGISNSLLNEVLVMPVNDIEKCKKIIYENKSSLACIIMEPIISNLGYMPLDNIFLKFIRDITEELGIVLIFDEIQSFRISRGGAQETLGITPDLTSLGKIIGGGLPVGAFGGKEEIMDLFNPSSENFLVSHSGTFNGNPMTMEAGVSVLEELTNEKYVQMNNLGNELREKLTSVFNELDLKANITGIGSLFAINFNESEVNDYRTFIKRDLLLGRIFFLGLLNQGVLWQTKNAGALNILSSSEEVDEFVRASSEILEKIKTVN
tara:strand:+ start:1742 stop:3091 length:1350 start_codon:yes stop_codon:yes gene_type:complete